MFRQFLNSIDVYVPLISLVALVALPFAAALVGGYCYRRWVENVRT